MQHTVLIVLRGEVLWHQRQLKNGQIGLKKKALAFSVFRLNELLFYLKGLSRTLTRSIFQHLWKFCKTKQCLDKSI